MVMGRPRKEEATNIRCYKSVDVVILENAKALKMSTPDYLKKVFVTDKVA